MGRTRRMRCSWRGRVAMRAAVVIVAGLGLAVPVQSKPLSFGRRVRLQQQLDELLRGGGVPLDTAERGVERYLARSALLASRYRTKIDARRMQQELFRMVKESKDRATLRELFDALGNDPALAAECLARRNLAVRMFSEQFAWDSEIHAPVGSEAEALRRRLTPDNFYRLAGKRLRVRPLQQRHPRRPPGPSRGRMSARRTAHGWERRGLGGSWRHPKGVSMAHGSPPPAGSISPVEERREAFEIRRIVGDKEQALVFPKVSEQAWLDARIAAGDLPAGWRTPGDLGRGYILPSGPSTPGPGLGGTAPDPRGGHVGVWNGKKMFVWGGYDHTEYVSGSLYDPVTDAWRRSSEQGAPSARYGVVAVAAGRRIIVYGGFHTDPSTWPPVVLADGAIYDPDSDTWQPMTTAGAPPARAVQDAIFTGTEMIIFGGEDATTGESLDSGYAYNPSTDRFRSISSVGAPSPRESHGTVFTGKEMIVFGGWNKQTDTYLRSGAAYDPVTNRWRSITKVGAPSRRAGPIAVYTGKEMIIYGGFDRNTAGLPARAYNPVTDQWRRLPRQGPLAMGEGYAAVMVGDDMVILGRGETARYDTKTDRFIASAPSPVSANGSFISTGSEAIVWGGEVYSYPVSGTYGTGARYDPISDQWARTYVSAIDVRNEASAVATPGEVITFGGWQDYTYSGLRSGFRYDLATDSWLPMSDAPFPGDKPRAFLYGGEMLVFSQGWRQGLRYDIAADRWRTTQPIGVPPSASVETAVFTGQELIASGTDGSTFFASAYDPATDTWRTLSKVGAPSARRWYGAELTDKEMIIWGGLGSSGTLGDGASYDLTTDTWRPVSSGPNVPSPRWQPVAKWTGNRLVVFGGASGSVFLSDGAMYDPATDTWEPMSSQGAPFATSKTVAVVHSGRLLLWGGCDDWDCNSNEGGVFDPVTNSWTATTLAGAPAPRALSAFTLLGSQLFVVAGQYFRSYTWTGYRSGGIYDIPSDSWGFGSFSAPKMGDDILAATGPGGLAFYGAGIRGYRGDAATTPTSFDAFPGLRGFGAEIAAGDIEAGGNAEILAAPGPGRAFPPDIAAFDRDGIPRSGFPFAAYGTSSYGATVGTGGIDGAVEVLTGPGPSPVFGPQVRAFHDDAGSVAPIPGVNFYAYGTLRYGVLPAGGHLSATTLEEIVTGAGPGAVFGPHVRAFFYDGRRVSPVTAVNFFAYKTPRYGVRVAAGDIDADGRDEMVTGPGPSSAFAAHLRAFRYRRGRVSSVPGVDAVVFTFSYGLHPATGDIENDGYEEILCGPGPDPRAMSLLRGFDLDGGALTPVRDLSIDPFSLRYGLMVASGDVGY